MLVDRIRATLDRLGVLMPGDTLVVGVSGGPDSLTLLDVLNRLSHDLRIALHVAHLDHQLREDSTDDARFVEARAGALGLPVTVERASVAVLARERRLGVEEAARAARLDFFGRVVSATGARGVALGHTADDQVETIVLALLRGAGPGGLRGMRPVSRVRLPDRAEPLLLIRPLLGTKRDEVEAYLRERGLVPRRDPTNDETSFRRNRVRHEVLPALRAINPRLDEALLRLGRLADADEAYLAERVSEVWPSIAAVAPSAISLDRPTLRALPTSLSSRLLREAYRQLRGDLLELGADHVDAALSLLASERTGSVLDWPRDVRVRLDYDRLVVEEAAAASPAPALPDEPVELAVPGSVTLSTGSRIIARLTATPCEWEDTAQDHVDLDLDLVGRRLAVRRREPGDRIVPHGMRGTKKVQDLLVDAKVPRGERDRVPLVVGDRGIVWVAGVRADDRYRVGPDTRAVLCLRLEQTGSLTGER